MKKLVVGIAGPTGIGKTELALKLANRLNGELLSCDSVQVYRHLQIGANKYYPPPDAAPQHLIDVLEPNEDFSAADFYKRCVECIKEVILRDHVPILVGGTGFYFDWLIKGRPSAPLVSHTILSKVQESIKNEADWEISFGRLKEIDPEYAKVILPNDYYRLAKAIGFNQEYGHKLSSFGRQKALFGYEIDWRCIYLTTERVKIYRVIDERCEKMIQSGLIKETCNLLRSGLISGDTPAGRSIGYKETLEFIRQIMRNPDNSHSIFTQYLEAFMSATRQYARKQETWFANRFSDDQFAWFEKKGTMEDVFNEVLMYIESENPQAWIDISDRVKRRCRGAEEMACRRKHMRLYNSELKVFNNKDAINEALSQISISNS